MERQKYPIGIQNFARLREMDNLYVDKTGYIRSLVSRGVIYFLSRPRRFGKSLLLSTLEAFFEGKRELFKDLEIEQWDEWDWDTYPVIHIDLNGKDYTVKESLQEKISTQLSVYEQKYNISAPASGIEDRFAATIEAAYRVTGKRVVVLIDEYDKPILDTLHDDALKDIHRDSLRAFYSILKSSDKYLRFCFITGVTKFGQMNVFSGLNNLQDISIYDEYAGICGITEDELHHYFRPGVEKCAEKWECSSKEAFQLLKHNYDGYHFSPSLLDIYNPWSVLNAIDSRFIGMYWNQTGGGMSFVYRMLEAGRIDLADLDNTEVNLQTIMGAQTDVTNAVPVLFQTGYLTIKSYNPKSMTFILTYPNLEVESGFIGGLRR